VHGGVSAMALELVGSAAINDGRDDEPLNTASLRVNFLRQFRTSPDGPESRYEGTALRVGRSSGVAEAERSTPTASLRSSPCNRLPMSKGSARLCSCRRQVPISPTIPCGVRYTSA